MTGLNVESNFENSPLRCGKVILTVSPCGDVQKKTYYFAVAVYDTLRNESPLLKEVIFLGSVVGCGTSLVSSPCQTGLAGKSTNRVYDLAEAVGFWEFWYFCSYFV